MERTESPPHASSDPDPPHAQPLRPPRPDRPHRPEHTDREGDAPSPMRTNARSPRDRIRRADTECSRPTRSCTGSREDDACLDPCHGDDELARPPRESEPRNRGASALGPTPSGADGMDPAPDALPMRRVALHCTLAAGISSLFQMATKFHLDGVPGAWSRWLSTAADHPLRCTLALLALSVAAYPLRSKAPCRLAAGEDCA
jgi:hypothetical protein